MLANEPLKNKSMNTKTKQIVDSNVILRFILKDNIEQWQMAHDWFDDAKPKSIWLTDAVFLEVAFVLQSVYRAQRSELIDFLSAMLEYQCFEFDKHVLPDTLEFFSSTNLPMLDCYLVALYRQNQCQGVLTFDKKLQRDLDSQIKKTDV